MDNEFLEGLAFALGSDERDTSVDATVFDNVKFVPLQNGDFRVFMYFGDGQVCCDFDYWNRLKSKYGVDEHSDGNTLREAFRSYEHDLEYAEYEKDKEWFPKWYNPSFDDWLKGRGLS